MATRIAGVILPQDKRIEIALTYLYGVGLPRARKILRETSVNPDMRTKRLSEAEVNRLRSAIESGGFRIEGELRRETVGNIRRLQDIGSYRGVRHAKKLPVRGQRTKSNSRTSRGNVRKTVGSGKKPPVRKM